jgi:hypothetical protein
MAKSDKKAQPAAPKSSDLIAAAIASGDLSALGIAPAGAQRRPIGPPAEVMAASTTLPPDFVPWLDGDEWEPAYGYSPEARARLKAYLASAGLYGQGGPSSAGGAWTGEDAEALTTVLEFANGSGISDISTAAKEFATLAQTMGPAAKKPRAPLVNRVSNPESVRQVVRSTSLRLTGRRLSPDEEQRIIQGFLGQESAYNQAEYAAEGGGGTVTEPLSVDEYVGVRLENAPGAGAQRYLDAFKQIHQSLTGTITQGPRLNRDTGEVNY